MVPALKLSIIFLFLLTVAIYLFATAPVPLEENQVKGKPITIRSALEILEKENSAVRALYTKEIVGAGKKQKIKFSEEWQDDSIHAGLLPAQFLRETARQLERSKVKLGLFLGSDHAINQANLFDGTQKKLFNKIKTTKIPVFFYYADAKRYTYMFPDVAIADACVKCHNDHPDSPKNDWRLNDVMGATTWTYPEEFIAIDVFLQVLLQLRHGFQTAYNKFLEETQRMDPAPKIGKLWPSEGYFVPSTEVFMNELASRSSVNTLNKLAELSISENVDAKNELPANE